jgi:hypothetical protein
MASKVHVHLVAHSKKGERDRGAPATKDIKCAMEIGANACDIVSVWRDRKHEDSVSLLRPSDPEAAAKLANEKPGVILNVAKQRNGDFKGKTGLWFDQKTCRYRSGADGASWKILPAGGLEHCDPAEARRQAWETRRERYGAKGHAGQYRQAALCPTCKRLRAEIDTLRQRLAESVTRETSEVP